jgi:glucose/mannose transport system permease protein
MKRASLGLRLVVIGLLVFLTAAYVLPIFVMITTSLKTPEEINERRYLSLGGDPQFKNYPEVLFGSDRFRSPMGGALVNSTVISVAVTALACFFGGLSGYYLSRSKSRFTRILFVLVGIALYMPYQAIIIPLVVVMAATRLALTHVGLILSYLVLNLPLASVLMGTFFLGFPRDLEEAAEVDGASRIQTFFRVITPASLPAYASVAIIIFTQVWNEFFLALSLSTRNTQTVQVVMAGTKGTTVVFYDLQMAAALVTVAIPLVFFIFLGRYFVRGILAGALKG